LGKIKILEYKRIYKCLFPQLKMKKAAKFLLLIALFLIISLSVVSFVSAITVYNSHCDSIPGSTIGSFGIIGEVTERDCNAYIGGDSCYQGYVVASCGYGCNGHNCHAQQSAPATGWWIEPCSYWSTCVDKVACSGSTPCGDYYPNCRARSTWYYDPDRDGYVSATYTTTYYQCDSPGIGWRNTGYLGTGDCNDANSAVLPGAIESCNNVDDNCNGVVDENVFNYGACNQVGACFGSRQTCTSGSFGGCSVLPQTEILDAVDNNCDGIIDEGFVAPIINIVSPTSGAYNSSLLVLEVLTNEAATCRYDLDSAGYADMTSLNFTHFMNLINIAGDGNSIINVNCTDTDGQSTLSSVSFTTDTLPPAINIISPNSLFYDTQDIDVELTSDGTQQTIWYNRDGIDYLYSGIETVTFNEGWNTITAYVNDSFGNQNSRSFTFLIDTTNPILIITNPVTNGEVFGVANVPIDYTLVEANPVHCWWTDDAGATTNDTTTNDIICGENITSENWDEGSNLIEVNAEDINGNIAADSRLFNVDLSAPVINIITPTAGGIFGGDVLLSASINDLNLDLTSPRYEIRENGVGGTLISSGSLTDSGLTYDGTLSTDDSWGNRNLTLIVLAADNYGRESSASVDFVLDNSLPSITFINPRSDNSSVFNSNFSLNILVQAFTIASAQYSISDSLNNVVASNLVTPNINSYTFNDLIDISALADGTYILSASAVDSSTPADSVSASVSFVLDRINPNIIDIFPANGAIFNYNCLDVSVTFDDGTAWFIWNNTVYTLAQGVCTTFDEGSNTIEVYVNDSAGNINNQNVTFIVDTIDPLLAIIYPQNTIYNHIVTEINYTVSDNSNLKECRYILDDIASTEVIIPCGDNVTGLSSREGSNMWAISAQDYANNRVEELVTFFVDTTPPTLTVVSPRSTTYTTGEVNFEVSGDEPLDSCWYNLDSLGDVFMNRIDADSFNASSGVLSEGGHNVIFGCNDSAGNIATIGTPINFDVNNIPPMLTINSPLNQTYSTRFIQVDITSDGNSVWYDWNGTASLYIPETVRFNRWSNTLTAYANDSAGNINTQSVTFFVNLPVTIVDSVIYGNYYPYNVSEDVKNINFIDSFVGNSTVEGTIPVDIIISYIMRSNLINLTLIYNCTAIDSTINGGSCQDSVIIFSVVTDSNINQSYLENSTVSNSSIFNSTLINADVSNTIADNSNIINSTIDNSVVENANITNGIVYYGNITTNGTTYEIFNATNLSDIINYPPVAVLAVPASVKINEQVTFDGSGSYDPNIPGALNDRLNYSFDFGDGIFTTPDNVSSLSRSYTTAGTYTVNLIVTDSFGASDSASSTVAITAPAGIPGPSGGSGGGGGSSSLAPGYQAGPGNMVYWPTGEELARGYTVSMRLREVIKFFVEYKLYYFETTNLTSNHLGAEVRWPLKPQDFIIGQDRNIDVNNDGHEDVNIRLNSIMVEGKDYFASVTIKRLFKEGQTVESDVPPGTVFVEAQTTSKFAQFLKNNWIILLAIFLALVALGIALLYYFRDHRKPINNGKKTKVL